MVKYVKEIFVFSAKSSNLVANLRLSDVFIDIIEGSQRMIAQTEGCAILLQLSCKVTISKYTNNNKTFLNAKTNNYKTN